MGPKRIVCMTEETTEVLYRIGEDARIVGISAFTVRPARVKQQKPVVSQFTKADCPAILAVNPDLVLAFSDLQADICAELIRKGVEVHCFNQRSIAEILQMIQTVAGLVGAPGKGQKLCTELEQGLESIRRAAERFPRRPRVYFEEWHDPMITGIQWVSELIETAGGEDVFREHRTAKSASDRIVQDPREVIRRKPEVYLASWCGRKFRPEYLPKRPGWEQAEFIANNDVFEIDSSTILQPGPACLTEGVWEIHRILAEHVGVEPAESLPRLEEVLV